MFGVGIGIIGAVCGGGGGASDGCGVPTGAFHGFVGAGAAVAAGMFGEGPDGGIAPGIIIPGAIAPGMFGEEPNDGPGIGAGTAIRPAAAAAAIAGSSIWSAAAAEG